MFAFCSTTKTVRPSARICLMISKTCSTRIGARPIEGSSISRTFGSAMSARPIATICCSPPDNVPAFCLRLADPRERLEHLLPILRDLRLVLALVRAQIQVLRDRHVREEPAVLRDHRDLLGDDLRRRQPGHDLAVEHHVALGRLDVPRIVLRVVVFPLAFPPSRHTISPGKISTFTLRSTATSP